MKAGQIHRNSSLWLLGLAMVFAMTVRSIGSHAQRAPQQQMALASGSKATSRIVLPHERVSNWIEPHWQSIQDYWSSFRSDRKWKWKIAGIVLLILVTEGIYYHITTWKRGTIERKLTTLNSLHLPQAVEYYIAQNPSDMLPGQKLVQDINEFVDHLKKSSENFSAFSVTIKAPLATFRQDMQRLDTTTSIRDLETAFESIDRNNAKTLFQHLATKDEAKVEAFEKAFDAIKLPTLKYCWKVKEADQLIKKSSQPSLRALALTWTMTPQGRLKWLLIDSAAAPTKAWAYLVKDLNEKFGKLASEDVRALSQNPNTWLNHHPFLAQCLQKTIQELNKHPLYPISYLLVPRYDYNRHGDVTKLTWHTITRKDMVVGLMQQVDLLNQVINRPKESIYRQKIQHMLPYYHKGALTLKLEHNQSRNTINYELRSDEASTEKIILMEWLGNLNGHMQGIEQLGKILGPKELHWVNRIETYRANSEHAAIKNLKLEYDGLHKRYDLKDHILYRFKCLENKLNGLRAPLIQTRDLQSFVERNKDHEEVVKAGKIIKSYQQYHASDYQLTATYAQNDEGDFTDLIIWKIQSEQDRKPLDIVEAKLNQRYPNVHLLQNFMRVLNYNNIQHDMQKSKQIIAQNSYAKKHRCGLWPRYVKGEDNKIRLQGWKICSYLEVLETVFEFNDELNAGTVTWDTAYPQLLPAGLTWETKRKYFPQLEDVRSVYEIRGNPGHQQGLDLEALALRHLVQQLNTTRREAPKWHQHLRHFISSSQHDPIKTLQWVYDKEFQIYRIDIHDRLDALKTILSNKTDWAAGNSLDNFVTNNQANKDYQEFHNTLRGYNAYAPHPYYLVPAYKQINVEAPSDDMKWVIRDDREDEAQLQALQQHLDQQAWVHGENDNLIKFVGNNNGHRICQQVKQTLAKNRYAQDQQFQVIPTYLWDEEDNLNDTPTFQIQSKQQAAQQRIFLKALLQRTTWSPQNSPTRFLIENNNKSVYIKINQIFDANPHHEGYVLGPIVERDVNTQITRCTILTPMDDMPHLKALSILVNIQIPQLNDRFNDLNASVLTAFKNTYNTPQFERWKGEHQAEWLALGNVLDIVSQNPLLIQDQVALVPSYLYGSTTASVRKITWTLEKGENLLNQWLVKLNNSFSLSWWNVNLCTNFATTSENWLEDNDDAWKSNYTPFMMLKDAFNFITHDPYAIRNRLHFVPVYTYRDDTKRLVTKITWKIQSDIELLQQLMQQVDELQQKITNKFDPEDVNSFKEDSENWKTNHPDVEKRLAETNNFIQKNVSAWIQNLVLNVREQDDDVIFEIRGINKQTERQVLTYMVYQLNKDKNILNNHLHVQSQIRKINEYKQCSTYKSIQKSVLKFDFNSSQYVLKDTSASQKSKFVIKEGRLLNTSEEEEEYKMG